MSPGTDRRILHAGYAVGLMLLVDPVLELLVSIWPLQPSAVNWRFGALGLLSNALLVPTLGIAVLAFTASALGHGRILRAVSLVAIATGVLLGAGLAFLALDAMQLRRNIRADVRPAYDLGAAKAFTSYLLGIGVLAFLGGKGMLASRRSRTQRAVEQRTADAPMLAGTRRAGG